MMFGVCHLNFWVDNQILGCCFVISVNAMPFLSFATTFHPEILKSTGLWFHLASSFPLFPCKMWMSNSFQASVNKVMDLNPNNFASSHCH
jgi:hypothetical protein